MRTKAELLEALEVERLDQTWWITRRPPAHGTPGDDLAIRRRRRELIEASRHYDGGLSASKENH